SCCGIAAESGAWSGSILSRGDITLDNPPNGAVFNCAFLKLQTRDAFGRRIALDCLPNAVPPAIIKIGNRPAKSFVVYADTQFIASNLPKLLQRRTVLAQDRRRLFCIFRIDGNDDARLRFIEKRYDGRGVARV